MTETTSHPKPRRAGLVLGGIAVAIGASAVLYGILSPAGKKSVGECAASNAVVSKVAALEKGGMAAATSKREAAPVTPLNFLGPNGEQTNLEAFRGKVVLLNLWATWCVPCREEMPTLDRLQGELGSKDFEVVAVNVDTARLERAKSFLNEIGVKHLGFYSDPKADVFYRLKTAGKVVGLPTTILIGRDGCELAAMAGPADWASSDALALIRAAL